MQSFDHPTFYGYFRRGKMHDAHKLAPDEWLRDVLPKAPGELSRRQLENECRWTIEHRPYYSVYPAIADALANVTLDIDCALITLPLPRLLVRFAASHPLPVGNVCVRSFLAFNFRYEQHRGLGLLICCDEEVDGRAPLINSSFELVEDTTVESQLNPEIVLGAEVRIQGTRNIEPFEACVRVLVAICLMQHDPDLIYPDVLSADALKYDETGDPKYVDRTHRRGKLGWLVGSRVEVDPHFRRPHFGLRWTGVGQSVTVSVF